MRIAWKSKGVPPLMAIGGDNDYLRKRAIRRIVNQAYSNGYEIAFADSDSEVVSALTMGSTFEQPTLVVVSPLDVDQATLIEHREDPPEQVGILLQVDGPLDEKRAPSLSLVHGAYTQEFSKPSSKKGLFEQAVKFVCVESDLQFKASKTITPKLASSLVKFAGSDLGRLELELRKAVALAKSQGETSLSADLLRRTVHRTSTTDMQPIRDALATADAKLMASALSRFHQQSLSDPTMLLLRARGGPADLAFQWLQISLMLKKGWAPSLISTSLGIPEWSLKRVGIPAAKKWGEKSLGRLVKDLASVDRGVQKGVVAPWVHCESVLIRGCRSVSSR